MACGAALISTRNGGIETYATDRHSALLCPPRDPPRMAEAIIQLVQSQPKSYRMDGPDTLRITLELPTPAERLQAARALLALLAPPGR